MTYTRGQLQLAIWNVLTGENVSDPNRLPAAFTARLNKAKHQFNIPPSDSGGTGNHNCYGEHDALCLAVFSVINVNGIPQTQAASVVRAIDRSIRTRPKLNYLVFAFRELLDNGFDWRMVESIAEAVSTVAEWGGGVTVDVGGLRAKLATALRESPELKRGPKGKTWRRSTKNSLTPPSVTP